MKRDWDNTETLVGGYSVAFPDHLPQCKSGC